MLSVHGRLDLILGREASLHWCMSTGTLTCAARNCCNGSIIALQTLILIPFFARSPMEFALDADDLLSSLCCYCTLSCCCCCCFASSRAGLLPKSTQDIAACFCQLLLVNPVLDAQAIQQVQAVLRRNISSGTWSERAATKTSNRAVHD